MSASDECAADRMLNGHRLRTGVPQAAPGAISQHERNVRDRVDTIVQKAWSPDRAGVRLRPTLFRAIYSRRA